MMRHLQQTIKSNERGTGGWLQKLLGSTRTGEHINLRAKRYDRDTLLLKGYTALNFIEADIGWNLMTHLNYTLEDAERLGFSDKNLVACGLQPHHLTNNSITKQHLITNKRFQLVSTVCATKDDIQLFNPMELFKLGMTADKLRDQFSFTNAELNGPLYAQYFGNATYHTTVCAEPTELTQPMLKITGPPSRALVPNLKIDITSLM